MFHVKHLDLDKFVDLSYYRDMTNEEYIIDSAANGIETFNSKEDMCIVIYTQMLYNRVYGMESLEGLITFEALLSMDAESVALHLEAVEGWMEITEVTFGDDSWKR